MSGRRKPTRPVSASVTTKGSANVKQDALTEIAELFPGTAPVSERVREVVQQTKFQGPIPHPEIFRKYGEVIADAPERILKVFEKDSAHARDIQMAALDAQKSDNRRVHWMAWSLVAGGYALAFAFAYIGKDILSGTILATTLAGTITGFLQSRNADNRDKKD